MLGVFCPGALSRAAVVVWSGGDGQWTNSSNWTPAAVPVAGDAVVFSNVTTSCSVASLPDNLASLTLLSNYTGTITFLPNCVGGTTNALTLSGNLTVNGGTLLFQGDTNTLPGTGFILNAANITLGSNATLSVDGQGFGSAAGPAAGSNNQFYGAGGGAHGGMGGNSTGNGMGATNLYGSVTIPLALGSGGGIDTYSGYSGSVGGSGGGALALLAANGTVTLNGLLTANGTTPTPINRQGGGGSGGSLYLVCSNLTGGGLIRADGGAGGNRGDWASGGGGGGGRVRLSYTTSTFTGTVSVAGGTGGSGTPSGEAGYPGTFSFPDRGNVTVKRSFALAPGSYTIPVLVVQSNATLSCQGNMAATSGVTITSSSVTIDQGGAISADSQGFLCGRGAGCGASVGFWGGGGASHGGLGGRGEGGSGGAGGAVLYGASNAPTALGSGGGADTYYPQQVGAGGGAVHLSALAGTVTVNGSLSANGKYGTRRQQGGGGSGGSVWVECGTLAGSGSITALGGDGGTRGSWAVGGGGGGGRIALAFVTSSYSGTTNVSGGIATNSGTAGTITVQILAPPVYTPQVSNTSATVLSATTATLGGVLTSTGSAPPQVTVYWGPVDAVSNKAGWAHSASFGLFAAGPLPAAYATNISLLPDTNAFCYYRYYASNEAGEVWAPVASLMSSEVWLTPAAATASQFGPLSGTITVARASALTNEALAVNYTLGGSATSGVDFQSLSGSVLLPAGVATAPLVVTPIIHRTIEGSREVVVTLASGGYLAGASNQATVTIDANTTIPPTTLTWIGGDGQWTNGANWNPAYVPVSGDTIVFGAVSTNCTVESMPDNLAAITVMPAYGGTVTLRPNCVGGSSALTLAGDLTVNGGTVLLCGDTNVPGGAGFIITAANISVGNSGVISANAQGFANQAGPAPGTTNVYYGGGGGSYGGRGGYSSGGRKGGTNVYGSAAAPLALGSGGGDDCNYPLPNAGFGGGAVKLVSVAGTITINGTVSANGGSGVAAKQGGGGSGGSLWLSCNQLAGSGLVSADGGTGGSHGNWDSGGGGGGGRVKFAYASSSFAGTVSVAGGAAGSGTPVAQAGYPGTFSFPDGADLTVKRSFALAPGSYSFPSLVVQSNAILSCQGDVATTSGVVITSSTVTIDQGGVLAADGQGFATGTGPGAGLIGISDGGGGGSHGGYGGCSLGSTFGGTGGGTSLYGSASSPTTLGSGGGLETNVAFTGGPVGFGGGAILLHVDAGTITVNGTLSANGEQGNAKCQSGGGSGGSVWLICTTLAGSGTISADGGNGGIHDSRNWANGGGGGGGRVKCSYASSSFSGTVSVCGGSDGLGGTAPGTAGYPGTYGFPDGASLTVTRSLALAPGSYTIPVLQVRSNAVLSCQGNWTTTSGVTITSGAITVDAGGSISADAQGFAQGAGLGKGANGNFYGGGGASHAGLGGHAEHASGGAGGAIVYGSGGAPVALGSGGGIDTHFPNSVGYGGGAVHLVALPGSVTINGSLSANGGNGSQRRETGGGSGGSVWVRCGTLSGSGAISANGGAGGSTGGWGAGGGGGGGRVSLGYTSWNYTGTTNVLGGAGPAAGTAGTVDLQLIPDQGAVYLYR